MRRFIVLASLLIPTFCWGIANNIWLSSNTAVAVTTSNLCPQNSAGSNRALFHGVCVNTGISGSSVTVYNSSATATNPIATIQASTSIPCNVYDVEVSSGLTYSTVGTANVTILYQCY